MAKQKLYPFSLSKHAHDIEFFRNRVFIILREMESGERPMDNQMYDKLSDLYDGPLEELSEALYNSRDGYICWLTGKQIGLAKKCVAWAHETRVATCIEHGKLEYIQYC
jgi:hypothetical protein